MKAVSLGGHFDRYIHKNLHNYSLYWNKWNIPWKHFFAVFRLETGTAYLLVINRSSPYLFTRTALQSLPSTTDVMPSSNIQVGEVCDDGMHRCNR